jgi:photosystem II stability/assembly factor-like uncharacterized protein
MTDRKRALAASLIAGAIAIAGATAITSAATADVQVGASGWRWGNPLPQGNTLRSASFAGATGYAASDVGTLLKTDDGGATWVAKALGVPGVSYSSIRCAGIRLCVLTTADGGALVRTTDGGDTPGERITPSSDPITPPPSPPRRGSPRSEHAARP